eukprot:CAMPEP_0196764796 /NCGR_PEP_ID=MMETSP1095-20130614/6875_1 /TAXON_ID=96789 ORGANISM="Chromulina nebulosa, Strain UTEXLB2642" /NCGR_SAMPLE_ID=MMETSP1095 /ASSEMBLY_ACC=CAM_ASM_000446 /LENGTH=592 /DNA_ID=CAMNT_0042121265 /DNA_START=558 /DNA_END=2332 /DNA_ORIENTATION=-
MCLDPINTNIEFDTSIDGKNCRGHKDRIIYITGIPDKCTKSQLQQAIKEALTDPSKNRYSTPAVNDRLFSDFSELPPPDRIIVTQPNWTLKSPPTFERNAWVVMPSIESTQLAVQWLRNLIVTVPTPETLDGVSTTLFEFSLQVSLHVPRSGPALPKYLSHAKRIKIDTERAIELITLLDDERDIPSDKRFASFIDSDDISNLLVKPTDKLDIAIAYLRRVHYVTFYGGRKFKDEGHLLSRAPAILHRSCDYYGEESIETNVLPDKVEEVKFESDEIKLDNEVDNEVDNDEIDHEEVNDYDDDEDDNPRKRRELSDGNDNNTTSIYSKESEKVDADVNTTVTSRPPLDSSHVPIVDKRVDNMIYEAKLKRKQRLSKLEDPNYLSNEDKDIETIKKRQEEVYEHAVTSLAKIEAEGKARCFYDSCKKLFKSIDFLMKHIRIKHPYFGNDLMIKESEPFMRTKYEKDDILVRPLPAIEIETSHGIELRSINHILEKLHSKSYRNDANKDRNKRSYDNSRRSTIPNYTKSYNNDNSQSSQPETTSIDPPQTNDRSNEFTPKPIRKYVDVDAPTSSTMDVDYGVTIAPITKKRKLV